MITNLILAINPGSTSTKIAVYENQQSIFLKTIRHSNEELQQFENIPSQYEFRKNVIMHELTSAGIALEKLNAVVGRGGLVRPIESGIYEVNQPLIDDLNAGIQGEHASNLGGLIAHEIASNLPNTKAYIVDPVVVDELSDIARISGHPLMPNTSIFHALNQKAVARNYANEHGVKYESLNLIVAHIGGGISVGVHQKGRVVDVNNALDGSGPLSPERAGTLPSGALVDLCFSGEYSKNDIKKMICGEGGLVAHLQSNNVQEILEQIELGNSHAQLVLEAMVYQISKSIGASAAVLQGKVDAILLTGGIAHSHFVVNNIKQNVNFIAPVIVYPGEDEMVALAQNGYLVLTGELKCKTYGS